MKKNVGKKIRLMALLASLTLVLWGGVIACSSGDDDDGDNGGNTEQEEVKKDQTKEEETKINVTKTISFTGKDQVVLEASSISETVTSIKITVTGVTGTASSWWFWAKTDGNDGDKIEWKSGEGTEAIYEVTITTKIPYLRENGFVIQGAEGLTGTVTITSE